jgi:hypothetical protein
MSGRAEPSRLDEPTIFAPLGWMQKRALVKGFDRLQGLATQPEGGDIDQYVRPKGLEPPRLPADADIAVGVGKLLNLNQQDFGS